jgi:hypothetical protein
VLSSGWSVQPVTTEDQVGLVRCDGWVIGIQKIAAAEGDPLWGIILAVAVGRSIEAPGEFLAWLVSRAGEVEIAVGREGWVVHPLGDVHGIWQALGRGPARRRADDTP